MSHDPGQEVGRTSGDSSWSRRLKDVGIGLSAASLCLVLASNLADLENGKTQLNQLIARQQETLRTTAKADAQLESLARGLQQLAVSGDANAQKIVAELQANGVHIKP